MKTEQSEGTRKNSGTKTMSSFKRGKKNIPTVRQSSNKRVLTVSSPSLAHEESEFSLDTGAEVSLMKCTMLKNDTVILTVERGKMETRGSAELLLYLSSVILEKKKIYR